MKILVLGAGALGSLVGGTLSKDNEVWILGRREQVEVLNTRGLRIEGLTEGEFRPRAVEDFPEDVDIDLIIICVKAYNTDRLLEPIAHHIDPSTCILSLQNGLDNEERVLRYLEAHGLKANVMGGITCNGVIYKGPGLVRHAGKGETLIGRYSSRGENDKLSDLNAIVRAFNNAGLEVGIAEDIRKEIWAKTIINSAINPITAITGSPNGVLVEDPGMKEMTGKVVEEGILVASEYGIDLDKKEVLDRTLDVASRTSKNISSMLQDIKRMRRTEIDSINGAIIHKGEKRGIETPMNRAFYHLVKALERGYIGGSREEP